MAQPRRIGILTGGGDVPGLNAAIKGVVQRAAELGTATLGIRRGWEGLTHVRASADADPDYIRLLDPANTRTIDRTGGTVLHTSRTNPRKVKRGSLPAHLPKQRLPDLQKGEDVFDLTPVVLENLERLGIDVLITIGGDDTLSYSRVLLDAGFPVVAIPKTMDNDVQGTEYCIGFSSAITRAKELIDRQRTTIGSHERIGVFRIFGRDAGFTALFAAYVTGGRCVIPEVPYDLERLAAIVAADHAENPSHYAFVISSEGALWEGAKMVDIGSVDAFGHRHKANVGEALAAELNGRTGIGTVAMELTYDLRSGPPDTLDTLVATTFANLAMDLVADGVTGRMVAIREGRYAATEVPASDRGPRKVDVARHYDAERFRPRYTGRVGEPMLLSTLTG